MARTTKAERKRRREAALVKISEGYGFADTVTFVMQQWGCSRSTARRDCHWAHGELQLGLDAHDAQHLVTHLCTSLQRISLKAEHDKQFSASVGALRLLYDILLARKLDNEAIRGRVRRSHSNEYVSEWFKRVMPPGVLRGIAPIRRSPVGLGNQGASLLI